MTGKHEVNAAEVSPCKGFVANYEDQFIALVSLEIVSTSTALESNLS